MNIHFLLIHSLSGPRNLPEYFQNVAAFILKFGSSQSQTGSSSTLIFQMHFVTVHRNLSLSNILRPMKLASTLVTRCSESDSFLEHDQQHFSCWWKLEALNFFLCKSYRSLNRCIGDWMSRSFYFGGCAFLLLFRNQFQFVFGTCWQLSLFDWLIEICVSISMQIRSNMLRES